MAATSTTIKYDQTIKNYIDLGYNVFLEKDGCLFNNFTSSDYIQEVDLDKKTGGSIVDKSGSSLPDSELPEKDLVIINNPTTIVNAGESLQSENYIEHESGWKLDNTTYHFGTGINHANFALFASTKLVSVREGTQALTIPVELDDRQLTSAVASVYTKGITGTTDIQIRRRRAGVDADMLSTKITIGDEFFAVDGIINTSNQDVATGDQIYIDVDAIHSGTAPYGLSVALTFG